MVRSILPTLGVLLLTAAGAAAAPASPAGVWQTASRNLEIAIVPCGQALCGDVVRVLANNTMMAQGKSAAAPARVGLRILSDLRADGTGWRGKIYNRENGRTYDCTVRVVSGQRLEVRPYVVTPLIGQTQIWTSVAQ